MKKLLIISALVLLTSCNKECKDQEDAINADYQQALQHAATPAAVQELKRQRDARLGELDC